MSLYKNTITTDRSVHAGLVKLHELGLVSNALYLLLLGSYAWIRKETTSPQQAFQLLCNRYVVGDYTPKAESSYAAKRRGDIVKKLKQFETHARIPR
jgi:hypothetical protein